MSDQARRSRKVKDVLSKELVAVSSEDTLHDAIELMTENRVTSLPVLNSHGGSVGIISASDLIELARELEDELRDLERVDNITHEWLLDKLNEHDMRRRIVSEFMSGDVATISPESSIAEAANAMLRHRVHHLPVVDTANHMIGIISTMDLLSAIVDD